MDLAKAFQSTPPRRGRLAPPGGPPRRRPVSIHAPAQGATPGWRCSIRSRGGFNPRPRAGGDQRQGGARGVGVAVSIHAPAQGATGQYSSRVDGIYVSIHAPAQGATSNFPLCASHDMFQSTPPRRGRRTGCSWRCSGLGFNPRPRAGGDRELSLLVSDIKEFQSTPPRRGRQRTNPERWEGYHVSIHAPAQGATPFSTLTVNPTFWFQSTPPRRGRPGTGQIQLAKL